MLQFFRLLALLAAQSCVRRPFFARTDAEKLSILEKIDKILRSNLVKESDLSKAILAKGTCPDMCPGMKSFWLL